MDKHAMMCDEYNRLVKKHTQLVKHGVTTNVAELEKQIDELYCQIRLLEDR